MRADKFSVECSSSRVFVVDRDRAFGCFSFWRASPGMKREIFKRLFLLMKICSRRALPIFNYVINIVIKCQFSRVHRFHIVCMCNASAVYSAAARFGAVNICFVLICNFRSKEYAIHNFGPIRRILIGHNSWIHIKYVNIIEIILWSKPRCSWFVQLVVVNASTLMYLCRNVIQYERK